MKDYINHLRIEQQDLYWVTGSSDMPASSTKNNVGYGLGTHFEWRPFWAMKASFEHSVRLPLARELLGNGTTVYPNVRLRPENSYNVNVGMYGTWHMTPGHLLYYELTGFYRDVNDYIHAVISEIEGLMQYDNVSSVDIKGVEGELRYSWREYLQAIINCSYQDSRDKKERLSNGKPSVTYGNKIPNKPWLYGNAELSGTVRNPLHRDSKLQLGYRYQYVHWFYLTWEGYGVLDGKSKIPTQNLHSVFLTYSWHRNRYNLSFECNNLFDARVYDNYMLQKPGRAFFCKLRLFLQ